MANVKRFQAQADYAAAHSGSGDWNFLKKVLQSGQNRCRTVGDIGLIFAHWVKDREGKKKPVFCKGPDPKGALYLDEQGKETGEPVCPLCAAVARMKMSPDPAVVAMATGDDGYEAAPCYVMNVIDLDNPKVCDDAKHTVLLVTNEKSNFFGVGIANQIRQCLVNYGSEDQPADYETWNGVGLIFSITKTGTGQQTRYRVDALPAPAPLTPEQLAYGRYDLDDIATATPMAKVKDWLGEQFLRTYGVTPEVLAAKDRWIPQRGGEKGATTQGGSAPTSAPPTKPAPTPTAGAPSSPPPGAPAGAPPGAPPPAAAPAAPPPLPVVNGPDGKPLPPGWTWKMHEQYGQPFFVPPGGGTPQWERPS